LPAHSKFCIAAAGACLATLALLAIVLPQSFLLTAFSDVVQCLLLLFGTLAFIPQATQSRGRIRLFWTLMTTGMAFWLFYQLYWTYLEVVLGQEVPDLFNGDIVLFLHLAPMMAAVALRPQIRQDEYSARLGRLDFALLMVWWIYLYVLIVIPWQYVVADIPIYNRNLNAVYLAEKLALLGGLAAAWLGSKGRWRALYAQLFGASLSYAASSYVANWAISHKLYYSGSLYDIPLAASMAWIAVIGVSMRSPEPHAGSKKATAAYGVWVARLSMIAVFSLPLFAAWALSEGTVPLRIRSYRLVLTLGAALVMGTMVFVRQNLLDRELLRLLTGSRDSFENLKRLQSQIFQSEKLASVGQLAVGAGHELNNPLTAMLGYSDLLMSTGLSPAQHTLAAKMGHQVRRTRSLVASLLSFARQAPTAKAPLDLNTLVRTAVKLSQLQLQGLKIEVRTELAPDLPQVNGDSNQLLHVCLQVIRNTIDAMQERSGTLTIATLHQSVLAILEVSQECRREPPQDSIADIPSRSPSPEPGTELGLNACRGIVQEHRGIILCENREGGGTTIRVELPVSAAVEHPSIAGDHGHSVGTTGLGLVSGLAAK
jgi:signal transduction histidine kinase